MSIRTKIALAFAVLVIAVAGVTGFAVYRLSVESLNREIDKALLATALQFAGPPQQRPQGPDAGPAPRPRQVPLGVTIQRLTPDGSVVVIRDDGTAGTALSGPSSSDALPVSDVDVAIAIGASLETAARTETIGTQSIRIVTVPDRGGRGAVQAARDISYAETALGSIRMSAVALSLAGGLIAAVVGWLLVAFLLRPLRRLTATAADIASTGRADARVDVRGRDETGQLARAFNRMLDSLGSARAAETRLLEDAAHELRTPLTSIRANSAMLSQFDRLSDADRAALVADLQSESEELGELVEQTLQLTGARVDSPRVRVDLADVARAAASRLARTGIQVAVSGDGSCLGDPQLLRRAIGNLLGNAAKFAPGSPVDVTVSSEGGWVDVSVADDGPGFTPGTEESIFDRFWRDERFRGVPGSGLGLSIVADVARQHGGRVQARNSTAGGAVVTMTLPASR